MQSLRWLGLEWDEGPEIGGPYGPYFQMQRLDTYREALASCSRAERPTTATARRKSWRRSREAATAATYAYRYGRRCRLLSDASSEPLTRPRGAGRWCGSRRPTRARPRSTTSFVAISRFENKELDDLVIVKSDGIPTYNFAVVVDDATMHISHVIRGEDHIANTPKQILIYQALGWPVPQFAHLPMILGPDRSKLSKRHGATSLTDYADGRLPARGHDELPGPARAGRSTTSRRSSASGADRALPARSAWGRPAPSSTSRSLTG